MCTMRLDEQPFKGLLHISLLFTAYVHSALSVLEHVGLRKNIYIYIINVVSTGTKHGVHMHDNSKLIRDEA